MVNVMESISLIDMQGRVAGAFLGLFAHVFIVAPVIAQFAFVVKRWTYFLTLVLEM